MHNKPAAVLAITEVCQEDKNELEELSGSVLVQRVAKLCNSRRHFQAHLKKKLQPLQRARSAKKPAKSHTLSSMVSGPKHQALKLERCC